MAEAARGVPASDCAGGTAGAPQEQGAEAVLEVGHGFAAQLELAEQARKAARDELTAHQIERWHASHPEVAASIALGQ